MVDIWSNTARVLMSSHCACLIKGAQGKQFEKHGNEQFILGLYAILTTWHEHLSACLLVFTVLLKQ